jgi:phasin
MTMSASPFDVPNDMRDLAERGVEQARKAFEGFLAVTQRTAGVAAEAAGQGGSKSLAAHVFSYTEQNVNAAFDLASKLVWAKDPQEVFALQSEYLKSQIAALQAQAQEIGAAFQKNVTTGSNQAA